MPPTTEFIASSAELQSNPLPQIPLEKETEVGSSELFACKHQNCSNKYAARHMLTKHERVHTKPFKCPLCTASMAERRDLNRHLWAHHSEYAKENNIPNEMRVCPDCGKKTRKDNFLRHKRRKHQHRSA